MVAILLLMSRIARFWPESEYAPPSELTILEQDTLRPEDVITTTQASPPASSPLPEAPVPGPAGEVIDVELELDFELDPSDLTSREPGRGEGESGEAARISGNPDRPPSVVRIVEATARQFVPEQDRGQLEIIVNFLVDETGAVEAAHIMEDRLYGEDGSYESLSSVPDDLAEAVIQAAMQWRFRPARDEGEVVKAFVRQRFNY